MAHAATLVSSGQSLGAVVATALSTELGQVSAMVGAVERLTRPLVRQMDEFARQVSIGVLVISARLIWPVLSWRRLDAAGLPFE